MQYDPIDDRAASGVDVLGLYEPDHAAAAAKATLTDQGSGNWRSDD